MFPADSKRILGIARLLPMTLALAAALAASGCTRKEPAQTPAAPALPPGAGGASLLAASPGTHELRDGQAPFRFDYSAVTELLIAKSDPSSGDRWSARLERAEAVSEDWAIRSGPDGKELLDTLGDGHFISHLLDTLRTLQVTGPAPGGTPASLGLEPPRFALQWKTAENSFELRIGSAAAKEGGAYAWIPGAPGDTQLAVMDGAALRMLEYLSSFDVLRQRTLSTVVSDDVDEIELRRGGKAYFYAQREGDDWTDKTHHRYHGDVAGLLDGLTHARIEVFCEDAPLADRLRPKLERSPSFEAVLKDRHGNATRLRLLWDPRGRRELWAAVSSRPRGIFRVYPEVSRFFVNIPK